MQRRRLLLTLFVAASAALGGAWLARTSVGPAPDPGFEVVTLLPTPRALPAFALDAGATPLATSALRGRWTVLFFGFTRCPDVCPTTLALLARARAALPEATRPQVLFISVDPERDSGARADEYARWYDPSFRGATSPELALLAGALGAPYQRRVEGDGYSMDHSGALFLLDPELRFAGVATPPHDPARLARDLARLPEGGP